MSDARKKELLCVYALDSHDQVVCERCGRPYTEDNRPCRSLRNAGPQLTEEER